MVPAFLCEYAAGQGPFTYEALRPEDIVFQPLKQERTSNARELLQVRSCQRNEVGHAASAPADVTMCRSARDLLPPQIAVALCTPAPWEHGTDGHASMCCGISRCRNMRPCCCLHYPLHPNS